MGLHRLQLWAFGCDFVDASGRQCWTSRTVANVGRIEALAVVQADGWAVSRRPGGDDVRCPLHRTKRTRGRHEPWDSFPVGDTADRDARPFEDPNAPRPPVEVAAARKSPADGTIRPNRRKRGRK